MFGSHLFTWKPAQFQALSPILAWIYNAAGRHGKDLSIAAKFALGFAMVSIGFFIYGSAGHFAVDGRASSWVMIFGYGFQSLGELLISGLGPAFVARYVPVWMGGFIMGAYFVAVGISMYLGGFVATLASVPKNITNPAQSMHIYINLFNELGYASIGCMIIALVVLPWMRRLNATHSRHQSNVGGA